MSNNPDDVSKTTDNTPTVYIPQQLDGATGYTMEDGDPLPDLRRS